MSYSHPHLQELDIRSPGEITLQVLGNVKNFRRSVSLSELPILEGKCSWCNTRETATRRRKYCSNECADSAFYYCCPQNPTTRMHVLLKLQDCACAGCGEIFDTEIDQLVDKHWEHILKMKRLNYNKSYYGALDKVKLGMIGNGTGDKWQVDHIIPIHRGGRGIGLDNIQVLCVPCHKKKTIWERRQN